VEEMKRTKYTAEFKEEAVKQVIDKGHTVVEQSSRGCHPAANSG
jgi:transposase-like protein